MFSSLPWACSHLSKLAPALRAASAAGYAFVVPDGPLIPVDRLTPDRPLFSGQHRKHGTNLQVISSPKAKLVWVSEPLLGAVHDLTAARIWGIPGALAAAGLATRSDKGYTAAGEAAITPYRGRNKPAAQKNANRATPGCALPASVPMPSPRPGTS